MWFGCRPSDPRVPLPLPLPAGPSGGSDALVARAWPAGVDGGALAAALAGLQATTGEFVGELGTFFTHRKAIDKVYLSVCQINRWPAGRLESIAMKAVVLQVGGAGGGYNPAYLQRRLGGGPVRDPPSL